MRLAASANALDCTVRESCRTGPRTLSIVSALPYSPRHASMVPGRGSMPGRVSAIAGGERWTEQLRRAAPLWPPLRRSIARLRGGAGGSSRLDACHRLRQRATWLRGQPPQPPAGQAKALQTPCAALSARARPESTREALGYCFLASPSGWKVTGPGLGCSDSGEQPVAIATMQAFAPIPFLPEARAGLALHSRDV